MEQTGYPSATNPETTLPGFVPKHIEGISISLPFLPDEKNAIQEDYDRGQMRLKASASLLLQWELDGSRFPVQRFLKRLLDTGLSFCSLIAFAPLFLLVALLIRLESRGHPIFVQVRVGRAGRLFKLYKFRTMVEDAEKIREQLLDQNEVDGPVFKIKNDPRVTRIGRLLRRSSLDELPQLWNVLVGDMSLVGPRPALPHEALQWEEWQAERLGVDQGCTCIWQVSGRNQLTFKEWMQMDLTYVHKWSLLMDLKLIARTILVMITGRGAY